MTPVYTGLIYTRFNILYNLYPIFHTSNYWVIKKYGN